jgi:ubiquitin C-terminal hydrolase
MGVLCHQGEASSGHYISFIRDRATGKWNVFNDSVVSPWDIADLEKDCFGGSQEPKDTVSWGTRCCCC